MIEPRPVSYAERVPARVIGDGLHTVRQLIADVNADPRRGLGHEKVLTRIKIDDALEIAVAVERLHVFDAKTHDAIWD